jgi:hypothetical protein
MHRDRVRHPARFEVMQPFPRARPSTVNGGG